MLRKTGSHSRLISKKELRVQKTCLEAMRAGILNSAHDCSDGGMAVALAEMTFSHLRKPAIGATIELPEGYRLESLLFAEYQSRILVTLGEKDLHELQDLAGKNLVTLLPLGTVGGNRLRVSVGPRVIIEKEVADMEKVWKNSMTRYLGDSI